MWYICKNNLVTGPFTIEEIIKDINLKKISASDLIAKSNEKSWTKLCDYKLVSPVFNQGNGCKFTFNKKQFLQIANFIGKAIFFLLAMMLGLLYFCFILLKSVSQTCSVSSNKDDFVDTVNKYSSFYRNMNSFLK